MNNPSDSRRFFGTPKQRWVVFGALIGVGIGVYTALSASPIYRSRAQVVMVAPAGDSLAAEIGLLSGNTATPLTQLHGIFASQAVANRLCQEFGFTETQLRDRWTVLPDSNTNQLDIIVDLPDREKARRMADRTVELGREIQLQVERSALGERARQLKMSADSREKESAKKLEAYLQFATRQSEAAFEETGLSNLTRSLQEASIRLSSAKSQKASLESRLRAQLSDAQLPQAEQLDAYRKKVDTLNSTLKGLLEQLNDAAPEVIEARANLASAQQIYDKERESAIKAFKLGLNKELAALNTEIKILSSQKASLETTLQKSPALRTQHQSLLKDYQSAQTAWAKTATDYEEAAIRAEVERVTWSPLTTAYTEARPINRRWVARGMAGGILGGLFAFLITTLLGIGRKPKSQSRPQLTLEIQEKCNTAA